MPTLLHGLVQIRNFAATQKSRLEHGLGGSVKGCFGSANRCLMYCTFGASSKAAIPAQRLISALRSCRPEINWPKRFEKAKTYVSWGSLAAWIIDPEKRTAWTLSRESGSGTGLDSSGRQINHPAKPASTFRSCFRRS